MPRLPQALRIHFEVQYVGRMVKMAKRRVMWKFAFEGDSDEHSVVLQHTLNSGKKVVFLNGNQIFEEEKMSAGQFVYPFQLDGHLITIIIEAQVDTEGMYDLRVDGRPFNDLRITTLQDLRASGRASRNNGGGDRESAGGGSSRTDPAWTAGGAVGGIAADAPSYRGGRSGESNEEGGNSRAEEPAVASISMKDFIGSSKAGAPSGAGASGGGGGSWDPFTGSGANTGDAGPSDAFSGGGDFDIPAPAPASSVPPLPKKPTAAASSSSGTAHRRPSGGALGSSPAHPSKPAAAAATSSAYDPFADAAPAASSISGGSRRASGAPAVNNLVDDLAGLSFGAQPAKTSSSGGAAQQAVHVHDPFAMDGLGAGAGAVAAKPVQQAAASTGGGLDDLFGGSTAGVAGGSGGLVNLDNLHAGPKPIANPAKPTLGQMNAGSGATGGLGGMGGMAMKPNVMSGGNTAVTANLDFGLGMAGLAMPAPAHVGGYGMGMGLAPAQQQQAAFGGFGGAPAPAPAAAASKDYNPFDF